MTNSMIVHHEVPRPTPTLPPRRRRRIALRDHPPGGAAAAAVYTKAALLLLVFAAAPARAVIKAVPGDPYAKAVSLDFRQAHAC